MPKQAFDAKRFTGFWFDPDDLVIIGLDTDDGPEHPLFDERVRLPVSQELVADVKVLGVTSPIKVRKIPGDPKRAEVVFGRQRVRAARQANEDLAANRKAKIRVPALPFRTDDDKNLLGIAISENEHRQPDDPITRASKAARFISMGASNKEAGIRFGVTEKTIRQWLRLLELDKKVQQAVRNRRLLPTAAVQLHKLDAAEQRKQLAEILESGDTTVKAVRARVSPPKQSAPAPWRPSLTGRRAVSVALAAEGDRDVTVTYEQLAQLVDTLNGDEVDKKIFDRMPKRLRKCVDEVYA